jgi:hypothetical protein
LADIRGAVENKSSPSEFSKDYRPVYLFYGNLDISQSRQEGDQDGSRMITLEDYTFDDEYEQNQLLPEDTQEEEELCKYCGIKDIIEDVNDMFFCEFCNQGVHQLCEDPAIEKFEKDLDPWFCRSCCKAQNIPIPTAPPSTELYVLASTDENALKRKREEAEDHTSNDGNGSMAKKVL